MKAATAALGGILILLGIVGLFAGSLILPHERTERGLGPLRVEHQETMTVPVPPLLGGIVLLCGIALVVMGAKKS